MKKAISLLTLIYGLAITNDVIAAEKVESISKQLGCLTQNIYYEAGGEPLNGKLAVAQVTVNRVGKPGFPNSICGVVHQTSSIHKKTVCQFSWYCSRKLKGMVDKERYQESLQAAKKVLNEGTALPALKNAMYFHEKRARPNWHLPKAASIGNHIFYRGKTPHSKG